MAAWQSSLVLTSIAHCAESLLGPAGAVKFIVPKDGAAPNSSATTVCDGAGLLDAVDAQHPAMSFLQEVVHAQINTNGSGGTLLVVLAGKLAEHSTRLVQAEGLSPLGVGRGLRKAADTAQEFFSAAAVSLHELGADPDGVAAGLSHGCYAEMRLVRAAMDAASSLEAGSSGHLQTWIVAGVPGDASEAFTGVVIMCDASVETLLQKGTGGEWACRDSQARTSVRWTSGLRGARTVVMAAGCGLLAHDGRADRRRDGTEPAVLRSADDLRALEARRDAEESAR
jgi:hypothetical protein